MLNVVMPNVVMLNVVMPNVVMLNVVMPNVVMLNVGSRSPGRQRAAVCHRQQGGSRARIE
jgi:hypothetical protein